MNFGARTAAVALAALATLHSDGAVRRGSVAFHYGPALTAAELSWFGRFDVLVTHDPLPPAQVAALHRSGTRLVLYEWAVAFYRSLVRPGSFEQELLAHRAGLLNARPLRGGSGAPDADAFYYDPATSQHETQRPRAIAARLHAIGYDGVFLDTTTFEHVHPDALAEYATRHPETAYDVAFSRFMRRLRSELRGGVIITNQGYRAAASYLPYVDYDISESLITRPAGGGFAMRPWNDLRDRWSSIDTLFTRLIAPAARAYPHVRFVHLNYGPSSFTAPVLAIARLFGDDAFLALPNVMASGRELAYFADLGAPSKPIKRGRRTAIRRFAHGLVAVNDADSPFTIHLPRAAVDVATGARCSGEVTVAAHTAAMFAH